MSFKANDRRKLHHTGRWEDPTGKTPRAAVTLTCKSWVLLVRTLQPGLSSTENDCMDLEVTEPHLGDLKRYPSPL